MIQKIEQAKDVISMKKSGNKIRLQKARGKRISLISDVMFETMINNENNKKYSSYLLSLLFKKDYDYIYKNMVVRKNKLDKSSVKDKGRTTDFICDFDNKLVIVEMNNYGGKAIMLRNNSYADAAAANETLRGEKYDFSALVLINFNNFAYSGRERTVEASCYKVYDTNEVYNKNRIIVDIYIPNIKKKWYNKEELDELEKAILVMTDENDEFTDLMKGNKIMDKYIEDANKASLNSTILERYESEKAREKLIELQMREDIEDEVEERVEERVEEKTLETARKALENGIPVDVIVKITGLTKEKINSLK